MKPALKYYLLGYNAIAFIAWAAYGFCFITKQWIPGLILLNIAQGLAILEVVHAATGWVRSPVGSTAAQVASRILVLVLIDLFIHDEDQRYALCGLVLVSYAWTITELIRYSFYFFGLLGIQPRWLLWMRYTLFIVLYPLGVTGEWLIIISPIVAYGLWSTFQIYGSILPVHSIRLEYYSVLIAILFVSYTYYFPILYRYMWKQRKAKLTSIS